MFLLLSLPLSFAALAVTPPDTTLYNESYRPQYHFTPAHRWIGDPCGLVKHDGKYMGYSWGAAETVDLIHWRELNDHAIKGVPSGVATFTGSVVVDRNNTAGYGDGAMIAAFTSFDEKSKNESQSIAFSHDGGVTFDYYDLNPVIDIWSTEFRDPTVIWDDKTGKWVMLVAKALEKKVAFYRSDDLKHWEWMSDFGPMGDAERSWECPDMFMVPVEGSNARRWVLVVSVNWAREQYFVGDFDGTRFIPDWPDSAPQYVDSGLDYYASRVFQDYDDPEGEVCTLGWVNTWDYAQAAPGNWGKGVWSIPRKLSLYAASDGMRLRQQPVDALKSLRESPVTLNKKLRAGVCDLPAVSAMGNVYELDAEITVDRGADDVAGLNLCCGDGRKVVVSYDSASQYLTVDRRNVADVVLPKFDRIAFDRVPMKDNRVRLRILVDRSTIEIFANNGEHVFTLLTYPGDTQTGVEVFSLRGRSRVDMTAWPLKSIH